jgi:uncharacterized membrane protein YecN with MAPEG domain
MLANASIPALRDAGVIRGSTLFQRGGAPMRIAALYAGLLTGLFILLSVAVIRRRHQTKVALGHRGDSLLKRRIRVHANFAEYVPLALLLLALAESLSVPAWLLHLFGISLSAGRMIHAFGVSQVLEDFRFRVVGVGLTLTVLCSEALVCIIFFW